MKKLNYLLILLIISCSIFTVFSELDKGYVIILKDISIILTLTFPYILNKFFKLNISDYLIFIWIIFIFMAHYLGATLDFYNKWLLFDKITHFISGVLSGGVGALILEKEKSKGLLFNILFILSFTWFCAGIWEVFEFTCDFFFHGNAQKVLQTGVSDTMWDMIVAFIGSIIVSFVYYFRKK